MPGNVILDILDALLPDSYFAEPAASKFDLFLKHVGGLRRIRIKQTAALQPVLPLALRRNELPFYVFDGSSGPLNTSSSLTRQFLCSDNCFRKSSPLVQPAFLFVDRLFCCKDGRLIDLFKFKGRCFLHHP